MRGSEASRISRDSFAGFSNVRLVAQQFEPTAVCRNQTEPHMKHAFCFAYETCILFHTCFMGVHTYFIHGFAGCRKLGFRRWLVHLSPSLLSSSPPFLVSFPGPSFLFPFSDHRLIFCLLRSLLSSQPLPSSPREAMRKSTGGGGGKGGGGERG